MPPVLTPRCVAHSGWWSGQVSNKKRFAKDVPPVTTCSGECYTDHSDTAHTLDIRSTIFKHLHWCVHVHHTLCTHVLILSRISLYVSVCTYTCVHCTYVQPCTHSCIAILFNVRIHIWLCSAESRHYWGHMTLTFHRETETTRAFWRRRANIQWTGRDITWDKWNHTPNAIINYYSINNW